MRLAKSCFLFWVAVYPVVGADDTPGLPERRDVLVVTGTYQPVPLEEADRTVKVLDVEDLPLLSNSLADFLRLDPSLDLRERAPNGVQTDLSIRGATFGQTVVLLDGIRLNDAQSGHHNLDIPVPLEAVSRIEVLRGAGSTLYGSDAVGGVVNFVTRPPEYSEGTLRTALGSFGTNQQRAMFAFVHGGVGERLTASRDFSTGFRPDRDYRNLSLASSTHFDSPVGSTELLLAHNDRPFGADQFYGAFDSWERTKTWFAALRQSLGKNTEAAFAFRRHTDLFVLRRSNPDAFTNRHAVEGWQATLRRREELGRNIQLFYGAEGLGDRIDSSNLGRHSRTRGAGYAALDVRALRRFSFSIGGREEVYRAWRGQFSPSVSAGAWLTSRLKVRAGVSRAFRIPSYTDLYYHDPANLGSSSLRPESAWSYESGLDWNAGGHLRGEVTVFQRRDRNGIDYVLLHPGDLWRATNIQRLRFTGVEASAYAPIARVHRLQFSYTSLRGARDALGGLVSRYAFNYPVHSAVAGWQGSLPFGLSGRTRIGAIQRLNRGAYATWDAYLARLQGRVRPFVQASNLTNTHYEEISGIPMPGRSLLGGLEIVLFGRK
jgi:iron complex outermembrane recepter protein